MDELLQELCEKFPPASDWAIGTASAIVDNPLPRALASLEGGLVRHKAFADFASQHLGNKFVADRTTRTLW